VSAPTGIRRRLAAAAAAVWAQVRAHSVLAFTLAAGAAIAQVCGIAFWILDRRFERVLDARDARAAALELRLLREIDREEGRAGLIRAINRRIDTYGSTVEVYALVDPGGRLIAGSIDYPIGFTPDGAWRPFYEVDDPGRAVGYARAARLPDGANVLAGVDLTDRTGAREALTQAFATALVGVLVTALAIGALLNRMILARIDQVVVTSQRIMAGALDDRIPVTDAQGAFAHLAGALNAMLDRIAALIMQMRAVTDAIAHDLRLPLQRVRAGLEKAALQEDATAMRDAVDDAMAEAADALATFDLLLEIARAQSGVGRDVFLPVVLDDLVRDVVDVFGPFAEERDITLSHGTPRSEILTVPGHSVLLRQALGNLVHNAIKYAGPGATVSVSAEILGDEAALIVEDNGPGIPVEDLDVVLQPFGRLARDAGAEGKGLGLALVAACAKLHGGRLALEDARPGLRAALRLPRA